MQRLAAVYTNLENLPFFEGENPHKWIEEYCEKCMICVKKCPANAIYEKPIIKTEKIMTHIDSEKCFPFFGKQNGCSICIKECTFNKTSYEKIKRSYLKEQRKV
ncbi:MAG: 4Fe-4S binding protein [Candidatus Heimdallarchaeaceae archaeon]